MGGLTLISHSKQRDRVRDAWRAGLSHAEIAQKFGLKLTRVKSWTANLLRHNESRRSSDYKHRNPRNLFEQLSKHGHDYDYEPQPTEQFIATEHGPGSQDKIDVLASRLELGLPLWHPNDERMCERVSGQSERNARVMAKLCRVKVGGKHLAE